MFSREGKKQHRFARQSGGFSFFFCPNKRKTKQKENSPSAFFCLLRYFFPLKKKNSLRSNSFFFLTLQKAPTLHGKKKRPDLDVYQGGEETTSLRSLEWMFSLSLFLHSTNHKLQRAKQCCVLRWRTGIQWRSVKKIGRISVKNKKLFERQRVLFVQEIHPIFSSGAGAGSLSFLLSFFFLLPERKK